MNKKLLFLVFFGLLLLSFGYFVSAPEAQTEPQATQNCYFDYNNNPQVDKLLNAFKQEPNKQTVREDYALRLKNLGYKQIDISLYKQLMETKDTE